MTLAGAEVAEVAVARDAQARAELEQQAVAGIAALRAAVSRAAVGKPDDHPNDERT